MKIRFIFTIIAIVATMSATAQEYTQEKILYKNGNIKEEGTMYLGLRFGTWKFYSPDGKLAAQTDFYKDMLHGENTTFYDNGKSEQSPRSTFSYTPKQKPNAHLKNKVPSIFDIVIKPETDVLRIEFLN